MEEKLVELTRLLLGNEPEEALVRFAAQLAQEQILGCCHLDELPNGLLRTAASLAAELYRRGAFGTGALQPQAKSVTRMDVSYTFLTPAEQMQQAAGEAGLLAGYATQLASYRKMRW